MKDMIWTTIAVYMILPIVLLGGIVAYIMLPELLSHWQFYAIALIPISWGLYLGLKNN